MGKARFVVLDGEEQEQHDGIANPGIIFSPDSQRWGYGARAGKKSLVVVDGQEQKQYDGFAEAFVFSPDSKRLPSMLTWVPVSNSVPVKTLSSQSVHQQGLHWASSNAARQKSAPPLSSSTNIFSQPAAWRASFCKSRFWSWVETRA